MTEESTKQEIKKGMRCSCVFGSCPYCRITICGNCGMEYETWYKAGCPVCDADEDYPYPGLEFGIRAT
jgi:hypothetical protein